MLELIRCDSPVGLSTLGPEHMALKRFLPFVLASSGISMIGIGSVATPPQAKTEKVSFSREILPIYPIRRLWPRPF